MGNSQFESRESEAKRSRRGGGGRGGREQARIPHLSDDGKGPFVLLLHAAAELHGAPHEQRLFATWDERRPERPPGDERKGQRENATTSGRRDGTPHRDRAKRQDNRTSHTRRDESAELCSLHRSHEAVVDELEKVGGLYDTVHHLDDLLPSNKKKKKKKHQKVSNLLVKKNIIEIEIYPLRKGYAEGHHFPCGV